MGFMGTLCYLFFCVMQGQDHAEEFDGKLFFSHEFLHGMRIRRLDYTVIPRCRL
jgi:hypothetical protein